MTVILIRKKSGYVVVKGYDDTRWGKDNEAFEHRIVVEQYIGSELPSRSVVHHIDRVPDHNYIDNLLLLQSQQIHSMLHGYMEADKQVLIDAVVAWSREWMDELRKINLGVAGRFGDQHIAGGSPPSKVKLDNQTLAISDSSIFQQYMDIKRAYPEHLAIIQVGCFYEVYEDDARLLNQRLKYETHINIFTKLLTTGTSLENVKFLKQLKEERIPFVLAIQSSPPRKGRVLGRLIKEVFNG